MLNDKQFAQFVAMLEARGMTIAGLCQQAGVPRSHGHQVLRGTRTGKDETRLKFSPHLKPAELELLGWKGGDARVQPLTQLVYQREDSAITEVQKILNDYKQARPAMLRLVGIVQEHPEFFGEYEMGENLLDLVADKLEELVKHPKGWTTCEAAGKAA